MGMQVFPGLAEQAMRQELRIVRKAESIVALNVAEVCSDDPQHIYYEDKLGCARGVVFALGFQAVLVVVVALCWRVFLH